MATGRNLQFSWDAVDQLPDLKRFELIPNALPDAAAVANPARALDPGRADSNVYTEQGEVRCVCPETGTERRIVFQGFSPSGPRQPQVPLPGGSRGRGLRALPPPNP